MCAIFGIIGHEEAAHLTYLGLHALQHRGQEGSGIVSTDGADAFVHKKQGLVADVYNNAVLDELKGDTAIGHNRYSTTGGNNQANLQPLFMKSRYGWLALAHNGNLVNAPQIIRHLESQGSIFQTTNDTEVIIHLIARSSKPDLKSGFIDALRQVEGAYSLLLMSEDYLYAVKDPHGFRPLVMGELDGKTVFASETSAFNLINATFKRSLEPGEMIVVSLETGEVVETLFPFTKVPKHQCVFEYIYFARPDSQVFNEHVHSMRVALGERLAEEQPAPNADIVVPVPDSGVAAAIGFSRKMGIPFDTGIIRSHYVGRTFIEPKQSIRNFGVRLKLSPVSSVLQGKRVVLIDDSLVRGTTAKKLVKTVREAGAKEVHLRISAPPTTHSCFYGIDTPTREELLAANKSMTFIQDYIGVDSLGYLSLNGLIDVASQRAGQGWCHACFSGEYPTPIYQED